MEVIKREQATYVVRAQPAQGNPAENHSGYKLIHLYDRPCFN